MAKIQTNPLIPLLEQGEIIARSPAMLSLLGHAKKIAASDANVFIFGESGTGKEVLSKFIYTHSKRSKAPYISVNCAAIPENLLESEFFGHVKGAFTGAIAERKGRMQSADSGTLLLDEVTELPLNIQPKLLRAIQEKKFEPVGSSSSKTVDVRFIATSNREQNEVISSGIFRKDLYYRLGVIPLTIPPLRDRKEDIIPLATHFLHSLDPALILSENAQKQLLAHSWPGNVRELINAIEHAAAVASSKIVHTCFLQNTTAHKLTKGTLADVELRHILDVVRGCKGNKTHAAEILGISIRTLRNRLKNVSLLSQNSKNIG